MTDMLRVERFAARHVAVVRHDGPEDTVEQTRRPLYQHMIMEELVGGPSMIRFWPGARRLDLLVQTHPDFQGDDVCEVEVLPAGRWAVADWEGPPAKLGEARREFLAAVQAAGHDPASGMLQVHHMDPVEGVVEEQFQAWLG